MQLPKDPYILLSYINTQLRDFYPSFDHFCKNLELDQEPILSALASIDYHYHPDSNQFL